MKCFPRQLFAVVAILALALVLGGCGLSNPIKYGTIEGTVLDPDGAPMGGAAVTLEGTSIHSLTANDGRFHLQAPAGSYTVKAAKSGVQAGTDVQVVAGRTVTAQLTLAGYFYDFSDPVKNADWSFGGHASNRIEDGRLIIENNPWDVSWAAVGNAAWSNYTLEATVRAEEQGAGDYDSIKVIVRFNGGWSNYQLRLTRSFIAFTRYDGAWDRLYTFYESWQNGGIVQGRDYRVKIVVEGNRFKAYLDGELVVDVTDTDAAKAFTSGQVAFGVGGVKASVDDVVIYGIQ